MFPLDIEKDPALLIATDECPPKDPLPVHDTAAQSLVFAAAVPIPPPYTHVHIDERVEETSTSRCIGTHKPNRIAVVGGPG
jgi:hypothetical protein